MITIFSEDHRAHRGRHELNEGELVPCFECPERADAIAARLSTEPGFGIRSPKAFGVEPIAAVHHRDYLEFLETAWERWCAEHGDRDALPLSFPSRDIRVRRPDHIDGQLGFYGNDAGTPITSGTWKAIMASSDVALSASKIVGDGERVAFGLCRPPGHHARVDRFGGYCFLNNAAIVAQSWVENGARVAILDVDYHHGDGTQAIFYERSDVLVLSIHADPKQEYPYFTGYTDERGMGEGNGANLNLPLPWGTTWKSYRQALGEAGRRIQAHSPDILVLSLGVDTYEGDPISRFRLGSDDFEALGADIAQFDLPTVILMEGGYATEALATNVVRVLSGFENG